jgi:hypothetical protein
MDVCLFALLNEVLAGGEKGKGSGGGGLVKPSSLFGLWTQFNISFYVIVNYCVIFCKRVNNIFT